jgi:beta-lactamase regulating signal transducer with metallopeptidase domain
VKYDPSKAETDAVAALSPNTKVKMPLHLLWALACAIALAAIWGTVVYLDVQTLKKNDTEKDKKIDEIREQLSSVKTDIAQIKWMLAGQASVSLNATRGVKTP